jgi:signal transduction histidine kinase
MKLSLRNQIVLWYCLAVMLVISLTTFVAGEVTLVNLQSNIDRGLKRHTGVIAEILVSGINTSHLSQTEAVQALEEMEFPFLPNLIRISVPDGSAKVTFGDFSTALLSELDNYLQSSDIAAERYDQISITGMEPLRVYTTMVVNPENGEIIAVIQAGDSLMPVKEAQRNLWQNTLTVAGVGTLLAMGIGLLIGRRGNRALDVILQRINEIDSNDLWTGLPEESRPTEFQQLATSLNTMWRRLNLAASERQQALASISHELRTPLTAMQGQIDVLMLQPRLSSEVKESLGRMSRENRRLTRMVKHLLLNTYLESNPDVTVAMVNLRELLEDTIAEVWPMVHDLDLRMGDLDNITVTGDYDLIKQMLLNVINNAVKFNTNGGYVRINLNRNDVWAILEVTDSGQGIAAEYLPRITEPFFKGDNVGRSFSGGVGLGLSIVQRIVKLHQGELEIWSRRDIGTTVKIKLPVVPVIV